MKSSTRISGSLCCLSTKKTKEERKKEKQKENYRGRSQYVLTGSEKLTNDMKHAQCGSCCNYHPSLMMGKGSPENVHN
jgi:hypothetical protein